MPFTPLAYPDDVPVLTYGDVLLRAHQPDDADAVVEQCTDPESVRWTTVPLGYDRRIAAGWVGTGTGAGWRDGSEHLFAIECTHPDGRRRFAGSLSLRDEGDRRAELAFGLHPAVRGRGVCSSAVDLLLDHGFGTLGLETVVWWANVGNLASRKVAWRAGFTFGGTVRRWLELRGEHIDGWVATLHRDDPRTPTTPWLDVPTLTTDRYRLRALGELDADRVVEGCSDARTQRWLGFLPSPYTAADAREHLVATWAEAATGAGATWAVTHRDGGSLLAVVSSRSAGRHSAEIGYWTHPDARGRGLMGEVVPEVLTWTHQGRAEGGLGRRRAFVRVADGNAASEHVALTAGFVRCGRESAAETARDGSPVDMVVWEHVQRPGRGTS